MDYIVLDIEFNGRKFASELPMEVIEIGAVRLNEQLEVVDNFSAFIKPIYFSKLNNFIQKKTGIPQESIDTANRFPYVIGQFLSWLSSSSEVMFITWGGEDMKRIILDTRMHKLDDHYWMTTPYFDLLKGYTRLKGLTNDVSVEGALEQLAIEGSGQAHRALDDAIMTSHIFKAIYQDLDFERKQLFVDTYTNAKERRGIKNSIRLLRMQKLEPTWDNYVAKFIRERMESEDPRKIAEIKHYFEIEAVKPVKPKVEQGGNEGSNEDSHIVESSNSISNQSEATVEPNR
ncbi:3'-5' exonuclease [Paenibacillus endoradicis]|uniref:3'-5' exonuclease n=1 Tax=Paenibacillus endoradicis TaxID=2972487 RepID=UPI0021599F28|nr:3'-5' exonuclease [Paenibacillus endoradicis]MCR8660036.1 exonuclease domain-containing protein [Paenibacillus endoradicis]